MQNFQYCAPTEVVFGRDVENQIGGIAGKYGSKALLVYGKGSAVRSGLQAARVLLARQGRQG